MGNQPPRKNIPGKGGTTRHTKKMIDNAKRNLSEKKLSKASKIALGAGLTDSGKNFLAATVLASAAAYKITKEQGITKSSESKINYAINNLIKKSGFDVTKQGRSALKSGISSFVSSLESV